MQQSNTIVDTHVDFVVILQVVSVSAIDSDTQAGIYQCRWKINLFRVVCSRYRFKFFLLTIVLPTVRPQSRIPTM